MGLNFDPFPQLSAWGLETYTKKKRPESNWEEYFEQGFQMDNPQCLPKNLIELKNLLYYALDLKGLYLK